MESEFNIYYVGASRPTPGPGAYKIPSTFGAGPKSTISPRYHKRQKKDDTALIAVPSTFGQVPKISLGYRPHEPKHESTPGPDYVPPVFGSDSPRYSIKAPKMKKKFKRRDTPGPASYNVQHTFGQDAPKIGFSNANRKTIFDKKLNGGPVYAPKYDKVMKSSPRYSIGEKPYDKHTFPEASSNDRGGSKLPKVRRKKGSH